MEDKTEFPQEVFNLFLFQQSENGINIQVFPTANSAEDLFIFSPGRDCQ